MKKHIPNFLTCMNLLMGSAGCISAVKGDLKDVIFFVLMASVFDFLDGMVARLLKVKSEIGKQLDSLADMVSFGLLPALYMVGMIGDIGTEINTLWPLVGLIIAPFSALRLAKFNIDDRQADGFLGLPTPANAIMITSLYYAPFTLHWWHLIVVVLAASILLVSEVPMLSLKFSTIGLKDNLLRYLLILLAIILLVIFGLAGLCYLIPLYIILSIVGNLTAKKPV